MKILICSTVYPGLGGIPRYCENIAKEFLKKGHKIFILAEKINSSEKDYEIIKNKQIFRYQRTGNLKQELKDIEEILKKINQTFDLIIIRWYKFFRPAKKIFPDSKFIYILPSIRTLALSDINKDKSLFKKIHYKIKTRFQITLEKEILRKANLIIYHSGGLKKQTEREYNLNRKLRRKGIVIPPGIDLEKFKPKNKNKNKNYALVVANFDPRKGIDKAIKTADYLKDFKIKIIGEGKLRSQYEHLIKKLKLENKIELLGPKKNIPLYMNNALCYLMTSTNESFGLVILEAMASGLPVIAFKPDNKKILTASDEIIENNKTGFLVKNEQEMAKKIELLLKNKSLRNKMSKVVRKQAEKYSWEKTADKILNSI